jgi:hypothetical protein
MVEATVNKRYIRAVCYSLDADLFTVTGDSLLVHSNVKNQGNYYVPIIVII